MCPQEKHTVQAFWESEGCGESYAQDQNHVDVPLL